jgi:hypothetical protein
MEESLGFERLCEMTLTEEQGVTIKKCEKIIPKMVCFNILIFKMQFLLIKESFIK